VRLDGRKHGGVLLGILGIVIAVAAAVSAFGASNDDGGTTTADATHSHTAGMGEGGAHPPSVRTGAPGPGVVAPGFDVESLTGTGRVRLADYAGRPVVLTVGASWCITCHEEFPRLRALVQQHRDDDLAVIGITYHDIPSDSRSFAKRFRANFTLAQGGDGDPVALEYGIRAVPQIYFIDRTGVIRQRDFGAPSQAAMAAAVHAISNPR
jgi:peroxiredoxin